MAHNKSPQRPPRRDIYQEITDRILGILDRGVVPWRNPLRRQGGDGWPKNLDTGKRYRGVNVFLLAIAAWEQGLGSDYWLTYRQAQKLGGQVRKGEKASLVTFWKLYEKTDASSDEKVALPVLRHYSVFNAEQCDGIATPDQTAAKDAATFEPLAACEAIVDGYQGAPSIEHRGGAARYLPVHDRVALPEPSAFDSRENYYAVLFHELVHSTGHRSRLDRGLGDDSDDAPAPFGSPDYGKEELVAEMGAAFLAAVGGISPPTIEQSASYIDNWKRQIAGDKRLVVTAGGAAQKAADWILGERFAEHAESPSGEASLEPTPSPKQP